MTPFRLTSVAGLAAMTVGLSTFATVNQDKSAPSGVDGPSRKVAGSKEALGSVTGTVNLTGSLTTSDTRLADQSWADVHTATFSAGQQVRIDLLSNDFDAYLLVARRNGESLVTIGEDDDSAGDLNARYTFTVTEPGEYFLIANGATETDLGAYQMVVTASGGSGSAPGTGDNAVAATLQIGQTLNRQLDQNDRTLQDGSRYEAIDFQGRRGQTVEIDLASSDFDPTLHLMYISDGNAQLLNSDDDSGGNGNARIRVRLPYSGQYVLICNGFGPDDLGAYRLSITSIAQAETSMPNADWAARYPGGGDPNEQYAVLVGIDDYPGTRADLASCVTDTMEMRRALTTVFGFRDENIIVINDEEATREHIIEATRRHLGQAGPGGSALFYFSGHGLQLDGNVGQADDEPDGKDEAIYVWGETTASSVIVDEELGALLDGINAGRRVAVIDSCHSGTGTLGPSYKWVSQKDPWISDHLQLPTEYLQSKSGDTTDHSVFDGPSSHILLAACGSDQVASAGSGGRPSVFTYFLVREMERGGANQTFAELMTRVGAAIDQFRVENTYVIQIPQLEGAKTDSRLGQFFPKAN